MSTYSLRVDNQRCVYCAHWLVNAWACEACAIGARANYPHHYDDQPSTTATQLSRATQRRVDAAAEWETFKEIQGMASAEFDQTAETIRVRRLLAVHHMPETGAEFVRITKAFQVPGEVSFRDWLGRL